MEARSGTLLQWKMSDRVAVFTPPAMIAILLLFLWLVLWYDDIMPNNPPASPYENAFSLVCSLAMWPLVVVALVLGRDPPAILWLPLWLASGLFWALVVERLYKLAAQLRARRKSVPKQRFTKWALMQLGVGAIGCAFWFYVRASTILAHPADPENYGIYGNNWRFQGLAFVLSRLIPVSFGLVCLLIGEWYVLLLISARKGSCEGSLA